MRRIQGKMICVILELDILFINYKLPNIWLANPIIFSSLGIYANCFDSYKWIWSIYPCSSWYVCMHAPFLFGILSMHASTYLQMYYNFQTEWHAPNIFDTAYMRYLHPLQQRVLLMGLSHSTPWSFNQQSTHIFMWKLLFMEVLISTQVELFPVIGRGLIDAMQQRFSWSSLACSKLKPRGVTKNIQTQSVNHPWSSMSLCSCVGCNPYNSLFVVIHPHGALWV